MNTPLHSDETPRRPRMALAMRAEDVAAYFPVRILDRLAAASGGRPPAFARLPEAAPSNGVEDPSAVDGIELLLTGWGCPPLTAGVLKAMPRLSAIVHMAGSVHGHVTDACWERGIRVSTAADFNAVPVAEFTLAHILLSGKGVWPSAREFAKSRKRPGRVYPGSGRASAGGNYGLVVGLVGASRTGTMVARMLAPFNIKVLFWDPTVDDDGLRARGGEPSTLEAMFASCDVVSIHAPLLPQTTGLITGTLLESMRPGATLINTARGPIVDHQALECLLVQGSISAVLDVTDPEPLPAGSPLWELDNVLLTPHVAGAQGNEVWRMVDGACAEVERFFAGRAFQHELLPDKRRIQA